MTTLYWHDYETFGTNPRHGRPAQFAGLRTDLDLEIIGEPLTLYCQPTEDTPGHPDATLITGITPQLAAARGVPEPEFIARIVAELSRPGTCGVGYNSLRFDDEVTRHTLWRNFLDPYAREWRDGCSRWDIIDMVRLAYALRPAGIEWPLRADGAPSFRLEDLATANNLEQAQAHDALSDVHATIALARLVRRQQPKLYSYVFENRGKRAAAQLLDLDGHKPVLHVSQKFPAVNGCLSPVMPLAPHPRNRNAVLVYDLRADPEPLLQLSPADMAERIFTPSADLPADAPRVALKGVHLNKCPVLAPFAMLREQEARRLRIDVGACRRHWQAIYAHMQDVAAKAQAAFDLHAFAPASDADSALYDGFVDDADRRLAEQMANSAGAELAALEFSDPRLRELLFRYRARHFPDTLEHGEQQEWQDWVARRLEFAPDGGLTLDQYDELIAQRMAEHRDQPQKLQLLLDLKAWSNHLRQQYGIDTG